MAGPKVAGKEGKGGEENPAQANPAGRRGNPLAPLRYHLGWDAKDDLRVWGEHGCYGVAPSGRPEPKPESCGGVAPQPPRSRMFRSGGVVPTLEGPSLGGPDTPPKPLRAAFEALSKIRRHQARSDELLQSVGLVKGQEVTADKLRALIANAERMDGGREDAAAAIMNLALLITARDGKINAALKEVQKDAGLPAEIAEAICTSLDFLERDRAAIEGK